MKKICDWCKLEYDCNLTQEELNKQFEDDVKEITKLGYEATGTYIEVCDDCFNLKDKEYGIKKRSDY
jgi:hypothetical protein